MTMHKMTMKDSVKLQTIIYWALRPRIYAENILHQQESKQEMVTLTKHDVKTLVFLRRFLNLGMKKFTNNKLASK